MSSPASVASVPEAGSTHPRGLAAVAFVLTVIAAAIAYLVSGLLGLLILALTPEPGASGYVVIIKGVLVCGWPAIGGWLVWEVSRFRWRFAAAPFAAWAWVYGCLYLLQGRAFLNIGY